MTDHQVRVEESERLAQAALEAEVRGDRRLAAALYKAAVMVMNGQLTPPVTDALEAIKDFPKQA